MDDAGGLRGRPAFADGPGARFLGADREIGLQAEKLVAGMDQAVEAGLFEALHFKEFSALCRVEHGHFSFDLGGDDDGFGAFLFGAFHHHVGVFVAGGGAVLVDIGDEEDGLGGQKLEHAPGLHVLFGDIRHAGRAAFMQFGQCKVEKGERFLGLLLAGLGFLFDAGAALFEAFHIGDHQLGLDDIEVCDGIDAAGDVGDVIILKAAQHIEDGVGLADIGKELVAETFAF